MDVQAALRAALASAIVVLVVPQVALADGGWSLPVERYALANGLRVLLAPDDSLPDVSVLVTLDAGSADDPDGLEGLAHLVEHLAFNGSRDVAPGDYGHLLAMAGATGTNGATGVDVTYYFETVPPEGLERALWLEANRFGYLRDFVQDAIVERERTIVGHEYHLRMTDNVLGTLGAFAFDELYPAWHPYYVPRNGMAAIERAGVADVRAFLRTWYVPRNATVILAGHFDPTSARALLEKHFGRLPPGTTPQRPTLPAISAPGNLWIEVEAPIGPEYATMSWATPPLGDPSDRALDVAARLLAAPGGWLTRQFVDGGGTAASISAHEQSWKRGSVFSVDIIPAEGASLSRLLLAVQGAMGSFASHITPADVDAAKKSLRQRRILGLESSIARAVRLAAEGSWGIDDYDAIDAPAVADAFQRYLAPLGRVTMSVRKRVLALPPGVLGVVTHRERMAK
jgi:predicted Zn-dependent peptidase